jgi:hypothetical protein
MIMATVTRRAVSPLLVGLAVQILAVSPASGQGVADRIVPTNEVVITGYGTVGYLYRPQGDKQNEFATSFNPIFLFQFMDRVMFEAEFEFAFEQGVTETGLEYAQIDAMVHDNLTLVGGKFLLPFGVFGERLHPTWINKFATAPPIFGHHVSEFGADPIIPILSDIGVMARGMFRPGGVNLALIGYVTQGPAFEGLDEDGEEIPEIEFPASSSDINTDKLIGGRLDIGLPPLTELNVSYFNADYDADNVLDFTGWNVAGEFRFRNFEVRGEYVQTRQEIEQPAGFPELRRHGFYAQAAYRWRNWEPVFRWTQVFGDRLNGEAFDNGAWQAGFGLDYWFAPSIAMMAAYELNREDGPEIDNDRLVLHVAFGF